MTALAVRAFQFLGAGCLLHDESVGQNLRGISWAVKGSRREGWMYLLPRLPLHSAHGLLQRALHLVPDLGLALVVRRRGRFLLDLRAFHACGLGLGAGLGRVGLHTRPGGAGGFFRGGFLGCFGLGLCRRRRRWLGHVARSRRRVAGCFARQGHVYNRVVR